MNKEGFRGGGGKIEKKRKKGKMEKGEEISSPKQQF